MHQVNLVVQKFGNINTRKITTRLRSGLALSGLVAIADYGLVSLIKFFVSVYLARYTVPAEYGIFVLAFSLLIFFNGFQIGMVGEAFNVLAAPIRGHRLAQYLGTATLTVLSLSIFLGLLTLFVVILITPKVGMLTSRTFLMLSWVITPYLVQDFFRRALFSQQKSGNVLINDTVLAVFQIGGLIWLHEVGSLSADHAVIVIGISSLIAALLGAFQAIIMVSSPLSALRPKLEILKNLWEYGRWSLGAQVAFNLSTQGYIYAAGLMIGTAAAGALKACQNIVAPIQIFLVGLDSFLMAVGSQRYKDKGLPALDSLLRTIGVVLVMFTFIYTLGISIFGEKILDWLYDGQYQGYNLIVIFYAIFYLAFAASRPFVLGLRSIQKPAAIFNGYLVATILSVILLYPLVLSHGLNGAALGNTLIEIIFLAIVAFLFLKERRRLLAAIEHTGE